MASNNAPSASSSNTTGTAPAGNPAGVPAVVPPVPSDYNSLDFNPADAASTVVPLVYPFNNSPYPIPQDLFDLYRAGHPVPLSLLTLVCLVNHSRGGRPEIKLPLDPTSARILDEWVYTDRFLPFSEWTQASAAYLVLLQHASPSGHKEAAVYAGHILCVAGAHHGGNWDILREYDHRVRAAHAAARKTSSKIGFDIRVVNQQLLGLSAGAVRPDGGVGASIDVAGAFASPWARLAGAAYPDRMRIFQSWSMPTVTHSAHATSYHAPSSPKRKMPRTVSSSGGPSASTSGSSSNPSPVSAWCPVCCSYTSTHRWRMCVTPASPLLVRSGNGWSFAGKERQVCLNFNCNLACSTGRSRSGQHSGSADASSYHCPYGHYCSRCGGDHRSCTNVCAAAVASSSAPALVQQPFLGSSGPFSAFQPTSVIPSGSGPSGFNYPDASLQQFFSTLNINPSASSQH
ncbi:unnamed protein product [Tilletia laevis]|nr:hypothetical protein CF335_g7104 [Tilletia laevis]CAD6944516.1 unnamed protein product [Tilletia laevis]CAD6974266.1 unnamed protein product [Tilletia controversa]CAD6985859.1 unnamed protein product [Tilletia controversa]CAD7060334.1 unnamed protein product [Tilletia caries]